MDISVKTNYAQLPGLMLNPKHHISVEGRGTGKSFDIGFTIDKLVRHMPKGISSLTGQTFGQLLTRTLPSSLKLLQQIGYQKDVNFVVGKMPPRYFDSSYEEINQFKNFISFSNGFRLALISQNDPGSGRGCNIDYEMTDETLTIKKEQYDHEVAPANRGNLEYFGKDSDNPVPFHHGSKHSTSMPPTKEGRWVLDYAKYYEEEKGIQLFHIWNRIVKMQLDLLDITDPKQFAELWNEIARMRAKIAPFISKDGVLFTLANAFDNIEMLGLSYIKEQRSKMPSLIFLIEIMNYLFDKIEDCFYNIIESKHIYYNGSDDALMMMTASDSNFDFDKFNLKSSIYDRDCDPNVSLEIVPDWQGAISLFCVCQERNFDFVHNTVSKKKCFNFINEFYVKPDENSNVVIDQLCKEFSEYYKHHKNRELVYYRDRYGDSRNPNQVNSISFNQQAINKLKSHGWKIRELVHKGMEPPQSDKYLLWGHLLIEDRLDLPLIRFNGQKCHYTLISMNNAGLKDAAGKLEKDKSTEKKTSGVLPEESTHFSDAADKIVWTRYGERMKTSGGNSSGAPIKLGNLS